MKKLPVVIALIALAGCAQFNPKLEPFAAGGATSFGDSGHPDWLRDPAKGDYPFSPKAW